MPKRAKIAELKKGDITLKIYDRDAFVYIFEKFFMEDKGEISVNVEKDSDVKKEVKEAYETFKKQEEMAGHVKVFQMGREALEKEEIREVRTGNCPHCGGIGTPVKALYSQGWIHRLLVKCDDCGKPYLVYLGKENLKKVEEFEEIRKKAPECELYPWDKFKEEVTIVRGIGSE